MVDQSLEQALEGIDLTKTYECDYRVERESKKTGNKYRTWSFIGWYPIAVSRGIFKVSRKGKYLIVEDTSSNTVVRYRVGE